MRILRSLTLAAAALGLVLAAPAAFAQKKDKDVVQLKGGKSETGKIQAEDFTGLTLEVKAGSPAKNIPWADVQSVEYANPSGLTEAIDALDAGKLQEALTQFQALGAAGKVRPVLQQQALFYVPLIQQRMGKTEEAVASYKALFEAFPKSRYLRQAGENWIEMLLAKGDVNGAEDALSKVTIAGQGIDGFQADLALLKGRVLEAKKSWGEALSGYEAAQKAAGAGTPLAMEAELGRARCLIGMGKKAEALPILDGLKKANASNAVLAGTWNTLGDAAAEEGRQKRAPDQLLDALYMYLRGVVLYSPQAGESTGEYERALAGASRTFQALSELETNADRKKSYKQRADENLARLKRDFPNSPYLKRS